MKQISLYKITQESNCGGLIGIAVSLSLKIIFSGIALNFKAWTGSILYGYLIGFFITFANELIIDLTHLLKPGISKRLLPHICSTYLISSLIYFGISSAFQPLLNIFANRDSMINSSLGIGLMAVMVSFFFIYKEERAELLQKAAESEKFHIPEQFLKEFDISKREKEVLELLIQRLSYQEISTKLYISITTVKTHIRNIYQKTITEDRKSLIKKLNDYQN